MTPLFALFIPYNFTQDASDPAYQIAISMMQPTYKNYFDEGNHIIGLAQVRLDQDQYHELIAFPVENDDAKDGLLCDLNRLCPHYVIRVGQKKVDLLGVLYGWKVNRGDRILNGFYTLQAYTTPEKNPDYYQEYAYDPLAHEYKPVGP